MIVNKNTLNSRKWRAANPERNAEHAGKYRESNRDALAAKQRARAEKDRASELARVKAWQAANPERHAATQEAIQQRKTDAQERKAGRARPDVCGSVRRALYPSPRVRSLPRQGPFSRLDLPSLQLSFGLGEGQPDRPAQAGRLLSRGCHAATLRSVALRVLER